MTANKYMIKNLYLFRFRIWKGEAMLVVPYELYESVKGEEYKLLLKKSSDFIRQPLFLDLKNGNPFRGESFAIRYALEKIWKKRTNKLKVQETARSWVKPRDVLFGKKNIRIWGIAAKLAKAKQKEARIQYLVFLISFEHKTIPLSSVNTSSLRRSLKSSLNMSAKELLLTTMMRATRESNKNAIKATGMFQTAMPRESRSGVSQEIRISSLLRVQYERVKKEAIDHLSKIKNLLNFIISSALAQAFYEFLGHKNSLILNKSQRTFIISAKKYLYFQESLHAWV